MAMNLCRLRFAVTCVCRTFLGWLLMSITTTDYYRLLMVSNHLSDDLIITLRSPSNPITLLMMLLTSLLRRWRLLTALLELLVYRLLLCSIHGGMMRQPNIPLL